MRLETYLRAKELAEYQAITIWDDVNLGDPEFDVYFRRQMQAKEFTRRIIRISAKMNKRIAELEAVRDAFSEQIEQRVSELVFGRMEELQAENMQLRRALARITAAASDWIMQPADIWKNDMSAYRDRLKQLQQAIAEATAALENNTKETK